MNKIDLPAADPDGAAAEVADARRRRPGPRAADLGEDRRSASRRCSTRSSSASRRPSGDLDAPPRALIFDSSYDQYRGVVAFVRVVDGVFSSRRARAGDGAGHALRGRGARLLRADDAAGRRRCPPGEVGYLVTGLKDVSRLRVGDTLTSEARPGERAAAGLQGRQADGLRGAVPDRLGRLSGAARRAREAEAERRALSLRAGDEPGARASASAAASSACCTWRSCASGSSASSTSTCS